MNIVRMFVCARVVNVKLFAFEKLSVQRAKSEAVR